MSAIDRVRLDVDIMTEGVQGGGLEKNQQTGGVNSPFRHPTFRLVINTQIIIQSLSTIPWYGYVSTDICRLPIHVQCKFMMT